VKARVIWDIKPGVLVPINAVTTIGDQNFVFVAQENQAKEQKSQLIAHQVPVKLGNIQGQNYQVLSGLKPGDKLVVSGTLVLRDGIPIVPLPSSSPRSTGTNTSSQSSHRR
jgi:multidrug efflux pump subunit AcrA (membrane-fusion protein)